MVSNKHRVLHMLSYTASCKLEALEFVPSKVDTSLFYYNRGKHILFVLVYVDDIIVVSSSEEATSALVKDLEKGVCLERSR